MNKYNLNLNLGSEVLGSGKTITATEVVESASSKELAREVAHLAPLVDERTAQYVLDNVLAAATQLMSEGKAVILNLDGKAGLRLYVDVKLKAGSINLAKAKELDPEVPDLTLDNISALAQKAGGVRGRAKADAEPALQEALEKLGMTFTLDEKVERAYIARKSEGSGSGSPDSGEGGDDDNTEL